MKSELKKQAVRTNLELEKTLLKCFVTRIVEKSMQNSKKMQSWAVQKSLIDAIGQNERKLYNYN
jgi:hypothetical protein